ncbi:MAG TPA: MaoC family dehydratase N-terminal domain-containing protein [Streptosporangiaceae bacterium]|jgi:hydroxyacyl-ACP dehydratase HTD2-like protein with hotdog domain|nr:MaoC family dehydratase N-terminal domain-containing protein [Streptosporangiaceae bacterium]
MAVSMAEVYANTSKLVGVVHSRQLGRIERRDLERFSAATGAEVANSGAAGPEPVVAHPLYLTAVLGWGGGPANEELRPDGTEVLDIDAIPLSGLRLMGGGQDLELHADVTEGMTVRSEFSLEGVEVKEGRSGSLLLLHVLRQYWDDAGTLLVTCRETLMAR